MIPIAVAITVVAGLQEASRPQEIALTLDEVIFDSETDLDASLSIGWLDGALLVDSGRFAIVDGSTREIVVVDFVQGAITANTITTTSELSSSRLLDRLPTGHIVVADQNHGTISVYGPALSVLSTSTFDPMSGRPIGMFPDGQVLFRSEPAASVPVPASGREQRYRRRAVYEVQSSDGVRIEVTRAMSDEMARVSASAGDRTLAGAVAVIFGQRTLDARLGNCLVLSQTEWSEIKVIDRNGQLVASIPVAANETEVSQADVDARRQYRIKRLSDSRTRRDNISRLLVLASRRFGREYTFDGVESKWIMEAPANLIAPSIDKLIVDRDHRVWARLLSLSNDREESWRLWNLSTLTTDDSRIANVVKLPKDEFLLDARRDQVLVRTESNGLRIRRLLNSLGSHANDKRGC